MSDLEGKHGAEFTEFGNSSVGEGTDPEGDRALLRGIAKVLADLNDLPSPLEEIGLGATGRKLFKTPRMQANLDALSAAVGTQGEQPEGDAGSNPTEPLSALERARRGELRFVTKIPGRLDFDIDSDNQTYIDSLRRQLGDDAVFVFGSPRDDWNAVYVDAQRWAEANTDETDSNG